MNEFKRFFEMGNKSEMNKALTEGAIEMKNNIPFCKKCGDKLLKSSTDGLVTYFVRCEKCDTVVKEREKEAEATEQAKNQAEIKKAKEICFIGKKAMEQTFENDDKTNEQASQKLRLNYVVNFKRYKERGFGVTLYGNSGTGKTYLARAVLHKLIENGYKAKEIKILKAYNDVCHSGREKEAFIEELTRKDVIFIDDLGTERNNDAMKEFVYNIIDTLYENQIPIICTTNVDMKNISMLDAIDARIYSRIYGSSMIIEINAKNKRLDDLKDLITLWNANE